MKTQFQATKMDFDSFLPSSSLGKGRKKNHCTKYARIQVFQESHSPYKTRIYNSVKTLILAYFMR